MRVRYRSYRPLYRPALVFRPVTEPTVVCGEFHDSEDSVCLSVFRVGRALSLTRAGYGN